MFILVRSMRVTQKIITIILFFRLFSISSQESNGLKCTLDSCNGQIDTASIEGLHRYGSGNIFGLGNLGLPDYSMTFDIKNHHLFTWAKTQKYIDSRINEYDVKKPFTNFSYMVGLKKEQVLKLFHTQNISRQANFSFEFNKEQSQGFYLNQASNNNYFKSNIWYKTKSEKYKVSLSGYYARIFTEQNGGIREDSIFENDIVLNRNRELIDVNLNLASSTQKKSRVQLQQYFYFINKMDSLGKGSAHGLELGASLDNCNRVYKDSSLNLNYYQNIYLDSAVTHDSTSYLVTNAQFAYVWKRIRDSKILISPFIAVQNTHYNHAEKDTFLLISSLGGLFDVEKNNIKLNVKGSYFFLGYRKEDIETEANATLSIDSNWHLGLLGSYFSISPSMDSRYYSGNNQKWDNDFVNTQYVNFSGEIESAKANVKLSVSYNDVYNPVYVNYLKEMSQLENGVSQIIKTDLSKNLRLKKWHFMLNGIYQYSGGYNVYQLPDFVGRCQVAKKIDAFKNNLHLFIGLDAVYYSSFYGMRYSPELNSFSVNNDQLIAQYPVVDLFINGKIKAVRFFLKSSHVNAGLLGYKYYGALNYPLKDRSFQIGFSWSFIN